MIMLMNILFLALLFLFELISGYSRYGIIVEIIGGIVIIINLFYLKKYFQKKILGLLEIIAVLTFAYSVKLIFAFCR